MPGLFDPAALSGLFGGASQGIQALQALREANKKRRQRELEFQGEQDYRKASLAIQQALRDAQIQDYGSEAQRRATLTENERLERERKAQQRTAFLTRHPTLTVGGQEFETAAIPDELLDNFISKMGEAKPPEEPAIEIIIGPDGQIQRVPKKMGAPGEVVPGVQGKGQPNKFEKELVANRAQLGVLDRALAGVQSRPESFGVKGFVPDPVLKYFDPEGTVPRANVADVGSLVIHDRTGAAMSAREFPRLAPFIPASHDPPDVARAKLMRMREILEEETRLMEQGGFTVGTPIQSTDTPKSLTTVPARFQ